LHSLVGIVDTFDGGHASPAWQFALETDEDRALLGADG
jgi:hypothetical protein